MLRKSGVSEVQIQQPKTGKQINITIRTTSLPSMSLHLKLPMALNRLGGSQ